MKNLTLAVIALLTFGLIVSCQQEEMKMSKENGDNEPDTETQKALFPSYGWVNIDFDYPAIRGYVRIYPVGPCEDEYGNSIPCDPVAETIIPCRYPNGFCTKEIVTGDTPDDDGGLPVKIAVGEIGQINIALSKRDTPSYDKVLEQLSSNRDIHAGDRETLAKAIVSSFSFAEDSPLSQELVHQFRKKSKNDEIKEMIVLAGDYEIEYDEEHPNGFIKAYVKVL